MLRHHIAPVLAVISCLASAQAVYGMERILLTNGFTVECHHREAAGDRVRLYLDNSRSNYMEVEPSRIASSEPIAEISSKPVKEASGETVSKLEPPPAASAQATPHDTLHNLIASTGSAHHINAALLESVVQAESGGHSNAVSRAGAQGLMQLMPATARSLGVHDSFAPDQNLQGGTTYLDGLLTRYHDNVALALAAYNAGPGAVDRYHGVPPFHETRAYVARIIREFNRRTLLARKQNTQKQGTPEQTSKEQTSPEKTSLAQPGTPASPTSAQQIASRQANEPTIEPHVP